MSLSPGSQVSLSTSHGASSHLTTDVLTLTLADLHLGVGGGPGDDGSSLSDVSGISNVSNKTFVTEESSLVLETYEKGRLHHYLIPIMAAKQGKFQKRGTKLHIYMDHVFTAQHIKL